MSEYKNVRNKKRKLASEYFDLHDNGYVIYRQALNITSEILKNIKLQAKNMSGYIFNGKKHNDKKRLQKKLSTKNLDELFSEIKNFISENVNSILSQQNPVILKSLAGCGRQLPHTDYIPDEDLTNILNKNDNEKIPLLMLISIMPGTKICIWPKSINLIHKTTEETVIKKICCEIIYLNPGDVLIFRADCVHAGSDYDEENIRIHIYLDSPYVKRQANKTWVIFDKYNNNDALKQIIDC